MFEFFWDEPLAPCTRAETVAFILFQYLCGGVEGSATGRCFGAARPKLQDSRRGFRKVTHHSPMQAAGWLQTEKGA